MVDNLRFPKVMVSKETGQYVTVVGDRPFELEKHQIAAYNPATGLAIDLAATDAPSVMFHQQFEHGDFSTIYTKPIRKDSIIKLRKQIAEPLLEQVTTITAPCFPCDQEVIFVFVVYEKATLSTWYGSEGLAYRIPIYTGCCNPDGSKPANLGLAVLQKLANIINGTDLIDSYPMNLELKNYMTAVVTGADDATATLTITGKTPPTPSIVNCRPDFTYHPRYTHFTVKVEDMKCDCPINTNVVTTVPGHPASGTAVEVMSLEKESQGYDRVRNTFSETAYMKPDFTILAQDGETYDLYFVEFDWSHTKTGVQNGGIITEPYVFIFICKTGDADGDDFAEQMEAYSGLVFEDL